LANNIFNGGMDTGIDMGKL